MTSLLTKVRLSISIHAHRRVRGFLDGEYGSVFKGRSLDFEDMREYVPGDDIKDLDWKASARAGHPLIRRYVALRKHTVVLVVDASRAMAATHDGTVSKRDLAILAAGVMGWVANRHGDHVGLVSGDESGCTQLRPAGTVQHLERILRTVHDATTTHAGRSDLHALLTRVARTFRRQALLILIGDGRRISEESEAMLRRLRAQHEILAITVGDATGTEDSLLRGEIYDIETGAALPRAARSSKAVRAAAAQATAEKQEHNTAVMRRLGISHTHIGREDAVVPALIALLQRHRHAGR